MNQTRTIVFDDGRIPFLGIQLLYLGFILLNVFAVRDITHNIFYQVAVISFHICFLFLLLHWKFPGYTSSTIYLVSGGLGVILFIFGTLQSDLAEMVYTIFISFFLALFASAFFYLEAFQMRLDYDPAEGMLQVVYDKLFVKTCRQVHIPNNASLELVSPEPAAFFGRSSKFYILKVQDREILIAPHGSSAFDVPNQLLQLLKPSKLTIDRLPFDMTYPPLPRAPTSSLTLSAGSLAASFSDQSLEKLSEYIAQGNYRSMRPQPSFRSTLFAILTPMLMLGVTVVGLYFVVIYFILPNGYDRHIGYFWIIDGLYLFYLSAIVAKNVITVYLGRQSVDVTQDKITIDYTLGPFFRVSRSVSTFFHPQVEVEDNRLALIIKNQAHEVVYRHYLGRISPAI